MFGKLMPVAIALFAPCLWDRDTLRAEVEGAPEIADIAVGRFDRFPPAYYEDRLAVCVTGIEAGNADLALYDDAAVACDRLHRGDEAIGWMDRKRERLETLQPGDPFHEYTYLANLGTFHAHRWLRTGRNRSDMADLERAHELITSAIVHNPDAHFGRERYQQLAIEWLLEPEAPSDEVSEPSLMTKAVGSLRYNQELLRDSGFADAAQGLAGLVHLGDAWDSSLIWLALSQVLQVDEDASLARLASLRLVEIVTEHPDRLPYEGFDAAKFLESHEALREEAVNDIDGWFASARSTADAWRDSRNDFLVERIAEGRHPDREDAFWEDWDGAPDLPAFPNDEPKGSFFFVTALIAGIAVVVAVRWGRVFGRG